MYFTGKVPKCRVVRSTAGSRRFYPWAATKTTTRNCPKTRTIRVDRHSKYMFRRSSPYIFIFYTVYTPIPAYLVARCKWFPLVKCSILSHGSVTISTIETEPFTRRIQNHGRDQVRGGFRLINMDFQSPSTLKPHVYKGFPLYIYILHNLHPHSCIFSRPL